MKQFEKYLQVKRGLSPGSITSNCKRVTYFIKWIELEHITPRKVKYNDILKYIAHLKQKGNCNRTIYITINSLRHYFNYLGVSNNPVFGLKIRGMPRTVPKDLLDRQQLHKLYNNFQTDEQSPTSWRDKVLVGLLVYQGVTTGDIQLLKPSDVDLKNGTINISRKTVTNTRTLKLQPNQIIDFYHYNTSIREELIQLKGKYTDYLFFSIGQGKYIKNVMQMLIRTLVKQNDFMTNLFQIRSSVITNWLKNDNLRQVQYKAGHRYVSSTERYQQADLQGLQKELQRYFPLG